MLPRTILAASLLAACLFAAQTGKLPEAAAILDRYVEVTGGREAYEKVKSEVQHGSFEMKAMGLKAKMAGYRTKGKSYIVIDIPGVGKIEQGTLGDVAWERSAMAGPRVKTGAEKAATLREMALDKDLQWRDLFTKTEVKGIQTVEGEECYEIVLTPKEGAPETRYYSRKTGFIRKVTMTLNSPMGDIPSETVLADYKAQDGVLSPRVLTTTMAGQVIAIAIDEVVYNDSLADKTFELPADIKALVTKAPAAK